MRIVWAVNASGVTLQQGDVVCLNGTAPKPAYVPSSTGANAAGTEWFNAVSCPANSVIDYYMALKLISTDFVVGGAGTATALSIIIEGEQFVV